MLMLKITRSSFQIRIQVTLLVQIFGTFTIALIIPVTIYALLKIISYSKQACGDDLLGGHLW
ncbi:hypothetical protein BpHYR1_016601 [Brachionus plicatilis]|uniref:Uncharacterized protein n=1 Tax=Brachionus plicatilis TaxID=10195 RepID=A0A3M7PVC2_BRAPC|nr:hypothetical protein BpHYR1_016601 [Brachionus plicatilis]